MDYREGLAVVINDRIEGTKVPGIIKRVNKQSFRVELIDGEQRTVPKDWVSLDHSYGGQTPEPVALVDYNVAFHLTDNSTQFVRLGLQPLTLQQVSDMVHKIMNGPSEFIAVGSFAIRKSLVQYYRVYVRKS